MQEDKEITQLDPVTTLGEDDIIPAVVNLSGTLITVYITKANLRTALGLFITPGKTLTVIDDVLVSGTNTGDQTLPTFPTGAIVGTTDVQTLSGKRRTFRVDSRETTDTITPEVSTYDIFIRSAQAHDLVINNPSTSTPTDGEMMEFILTCDTTARAVTYGNMYVAQSGVALPSTLVASKTTKELFQWRAAITKWDLLEVLQET